jgi:hypothetical protein
MFMEKLSQMNVKRFILLSTVFLITLFTFGSIKSAHAKVLEEEYTYVCTGEQTMFDKIALFVETVDIRRTAMDHITATVFDGIPFMVVGKNASEMQRCGAYYLVTANVGTADEATCKIEGSAAEDCADLDNIQRNDTGFRDSRVAGTLLGLTNYLEGTARYEPIPVNLAYWWNDNVNRVPFAGKALAADIEYSGPFLSTVLGVWKLTRNIAYGLMALVMLVIGFMIITQKKIGGQLAVTAQLALPRIVIALILITFSYPIGAFGASMAYVLRGNAQAVVDNIIWTEDENVDGAIIPQWEESSAVGKVVAILFTFITMSMGVGPVVLMAALVIIVASLVFLLLCYIKFFTLYLRLLFSIISAPFTFAIGAIPGNEAMTVKWFKSFTAIVIGIPAMWFVFSLSWVLVWRAMLVAGKEFAFIGGGAIMLFIVPFVLIYGLNFARTLPDKIEAAIIGDKKR